MGTGGESGGPYVADDLFLLHLFPSGNPCFKMGEVPVVGPEGVVVPEDDLVSKPFNPPGGKNSSIGHRPNRRPGRGRVVHASMRIEASQDRVFPALLETGADAVVIQGTLKKGFFKGRPSSS